MVSVCDFSCRVCSRRVYPFCELRREVSVSSTAARSFSQECAEGKAKTEDLTEDRLSSGLFSAGVPDPDLVIRPSGELRLSNFLLWQSAYSEFYYSDVLWPDFTKEDLNCAIAAFQQRDRRYGGV